jgi:hypothetical protein
VVVAVPITRGGSGLLLRTISGAPYSLTLTCLWCSRKQREKRRSGCTLPNGHCFSIIIQIIIICAIHRKSGTRTPRDTDVRVDASWVETCGKAGDRGFASLRGVSVWWLCAE